MSPKSALVTTPELEENHRTLLLKDFGGDNAAGFRPLWKGEEDWELSQEGRAAGESWGQAPTPAQAFNPQGNTQWLPHHPRALSVPPTNHFSFTHVFLNIFLGLFSILCVYKKKTQKNKTLHKQSNPRKKSPARTSCLGSGSKSIFLGNGSFLPLPTPRSEWSPCCLA